MLLIIFLSTLSLSAITCGHPGNPGNGRTNGTEFNLNDVVNFTCNRGYILSGNARAQCRLNGQWSSPLPVCKGLVHIFINTVCTHVHMNILVMFGSIKSPLQISFSFFSPS